MLKKSFLVVSLGTYWRHCTSGSLVSPAVQLHMSRTLSLALLASVCAFAAAPPIDTSLSVRSLTGAQISPDGRYVAFNIQQANWDENDFVTQIWIAVTATGERYQLTSGMFSKYIWGEKAMAQTAASREPKN